MKRGSEGEVSWGGPSEPPCPDRGEQKNCEDVRDGSDHAANHRATVPDDGYICGFQIFLHGM